MKTDPPKARVAPVTDTLFGVTITDSYSRVEDGVAYPPVLLIGGAHDSIVPAWQAAKMAARLQASNAARHPVLLDVIPAMGHAPETEEQWATIFADLFVFLLAAMKPEGKQA